MTGNQTVEEIIELYHGQFDSVEIYKADRIWSEGTEHSKVGSVYSEALEFQSDSIELLASDDIDEAVANHYGDTVILSRIMDTEDYCKTVYANSGVTAEDFEDSDVFPVLCILV